MCPQFNSGSRHQYFNSAERRALFLFGDDVKTYTLRNLRFPVRQDLNLEDEIARKLRLPGADFRIERIIRKALDTRKFDQPFFDLTLQLTFSSSPPRHPDLSESRPIETLPPPSISINDPHPIIVGMGPAGLFCALAMVENGLQPHLFDRGDSLEERAAKTADFWKNGRLDEDSNAQNGEGGAGAFSDGKLTSRGNDPWIQSVFAAMISFGAPPEIAYEALPHLGTDGIRAMVKEIRDFLIAKGCRFHYRSALQDIELKQDRVIRARIAGQWYSPEILVLGLGNSARETFRMLNGRGLPLEPKSFALGLRIEQKQADINRLIYGSERWAEILGPAAYRLTAKTGFTFCMCPGGQVIAASTETNTVVTNGMSFVARQNDLCNSAIVTPVTSSDCGLGLWDGMNLQRGLETAAFREGYFAPVQSCESFLGGQPDLPKPLASYLPGTYAHDLNGLFSADIALRLRSALRRFDQILPGFHAGSVLIAPETRTSSPVRITRHKELLHSLGASNLYPIGEGSGYAGGIISSAADGWRLGSRFTLPV